MSNSNLRILIGEVLEDETVFTVTDLCNACHITREQIIELVEYGVIEPMDSKPSNWQFAGENLRNLQRVQNLRRDLGVNVAGAALALDLLDEIQALRLQLRRYKSQT